MTRSNQFADTVKFMASHLSALNSPLYTPSQFWTWFGNLNEGQLSKHGLENFKRSINQNYFNWVPVSTDDNQFRNLARYWGRNPALDVLDVRLDDKCEITTAFSGNPLSDPQTRRIYSLFVGFLWHYTRSVCQNGLTEALTEPNLGNPLRCMLGSRAISQDLANSIRERTTALAPLEDTLAAGRPASVVEIGAGYGRVAYVVLASAPSRYTIVDIPPALAVSQWYLTTLFPKKTAFLFRPWRRFADVAGEFEQAEIRFITPDQFLQCPSGYFDVGLTISTLPEMTRAQFDFYIAHLARTVTKTIYTKQWIEHHNQQDGVVIGRADFELPNPWRLVLDRVDGVQDAFFERQWLR